MKKPLDFGPYTIAQELRRTRSTRSFRATRDDGASVVLTCLSSAYEARPVEDGERAAFDRSVRIARELGVTTIAHISDAGESPTLGPYVAVEEPEGKRLDKLLVERRRLEEHMVHAIARQASAALAALGEPGLVHGHLQPSSFVVSSEGNLATLTTKLVDLPFRGIESGEPTEAYVGELYMAPEHVSRGDARQPIDERTDVHSLGLVFLELLVGTERFESLRGAMLMANRPFAPDDALSSSWNRLLARALGRDPRTRHENAQELADELETLYTRRSSGALRAATAPMPTDHVPAPRPAAPVQRAPEPQPQAQSAGDFSSLELDMGPSPSVAAAPTPETAPPLEAPRSSQQTAPSPQEGASETSPATAPLRGPASLKSRASPHLERVAALAGGASVRAVALAGDAGERASAGLVTIKSNKTGLALGGIMLAVGVLAMICFGLVRFLDDGEPSGPSTKTGKHTLEGSGATSAH